MDDTRYASRKFILTCAALLVTWTAFPLDMVTAEQAMESTRWILGLYFAGNVGDSLVSKRK